MGASDESGVVENGDFSLLSFTIFRTFYIHGHTTAFTWCDYRWLWRYFKLITLFHIKFVKNGRDPKMFGPIRPISKTVRDTDLIIIEHLLECGIKWSHDRWLRWSVNRDLGMFGRQIGSLGKSQSIGQTPCSYERYLVVLRLLSGARGEVQAGSSYIRWGRKTCGSNASLVYAGTFIDNSIL